MGRLHQAVLLLESPPQDYLGADSCALDDSHEPAIPATMVHIVSEIWSRNHGSLATVSPRHTQTL